MAGRDKPATWQSLAEVMDRGHTASELHGPLVCGTLPATGCVDGGERRPITPEELRDYELRPACGYFFDVGGPVWTVDVLSVRAFPASAVKVRSHPAGVLLPGGEASYRRVIADLLVLWPANAPAGPPAPLRKVSEAAPRGYQADRVMRAIERLEKEGWKLSDYTEVELRPLVLERIPPGRSGLGDPSRQVLASVIKYRLGK